MSLTNTDTRTFVISNGTVGPYAFTFEVRHPNHVEVWVGDTQRHDFSVDLDPLSPNYKTLTFTDPTNPPPNGAVITIGRNVPNTQVLELPIAGQFPSTQIEQTFDRLVMQIQEIQELARRSLRFPRHKNIESKFIVDDPEPGKVLKWGNLGNIVNANEVTATWRTGSGVPDPSLGLPDDLYLDTINGDIYKKTTTTTWALIGNLKGPAGPAVATLSDGVTIIENAVSLSTFAAQIDLIDLGSGQGRLDLTPHIDSDQHTRYAMLGGRSGGQVLRGGVAAGENLTLRSTDDVARGKILFGDSAFDELINALLIGELARRLGDAKVEIHLGTNRNLGIHLGPVDSNAVAIGAYNDAADSNIPLEIRGSSYIFFAGPLRSADTSNIARNWLRHLNILSRAIAGSGQSVGTGVWTAVNLPTESFDTADVHDPATPSRFVAPISGKYLLVGQVDFPASPTGLVYVGSLLNGNINNRPAVSGNIGNPSDLRLSVSEILQMNAGDYAQVGVFNATGSGLTLDGGMGCFAYLGE